MASLLVLIASRVGGVGGIAEHQVWRGRQLDVVRCCASGRQSRCTSMQQEVKAHMLLNTGCVVCACVCTCWGSRASSFDQF
jgi:hypothetical protein